MIKKAVNFIQKFLDKKHRRQEVIANFHTTIIRVDDDFISTSSIILDEVLKGNIYSLKEVIVAGTAEISGNVTSRTASISGKVYGDIISMEFADIKSTAVISGQIKASAISIEAGTVINGWIRVEANLDERELLEKVENRLPPTAVDEPAFLTYIMPEESPAMEIVTRPGIRPSEVNKNRAAKPIEAESREKPAAPNT